MSSHALAWPPWRRRVDPPSPPQGGQRIAQLAAILTATALAWLIVVAIEMTSLGSLATPGVETAIAPATGVSELADVGGQGPACHPSTDHPDSWARMPDLRDGTVHQVHQADPEIPPQHIWWDPIDGAEQIVVRADAGTAVRPYTVSGTAAEPILWFTMGDWGDRPTDDDVALYRLNLLSGEQSQVVPSIGGFEIQPLLITISEAGLLVSNADSTGSWLERFDHDGTPIAWSANPHPVSDYTQKTIYGLLSVDGTYMASIEAEDGAPWRIIVRYGASGEIISSNPLGREIRRVVSADGSDKGFVFLVETADAEHECVSIPYPAG